MLTTMPVLLSIKR